MTKTNFTIVIVLTVLLLNACQETPKQKNTATTTTKTLEKVADDIVTSSFTDSDGRKLEIVFNNSTGTARLNFSKETIELVQQKSASGIWYKNENYELRGKGNDIELKKNGEVVFAHNDDIVTQSLKDKKGQTLDITFNNTTNKAKVYLNGGEQIELVGQKPASGIWYKNDHYELRGKGENIELTKDGEIVFKR